MFNLRVLYLPLTIFLSIFITACGGGGGGGGGADNSTDTPVLTGVFLDSAVQGLIYTTSTLSGVTDVDGRFEFREGEAVTFSMGEFVLGVAQGQEIVTPLDFAPEFSLDSPEFVNALRVLQSLDNDGNPDNGIQLPDTVNDIASDIDITDEIALNNLTNSIAGKDLISKDQSLDHFSTTFNKLDLMPIDSAVDDISLVFDHIYHDHDGFRYTKLKTASNASLIFLDDETIQFNAVLPTGNAVAYSGAPIFMASSQQASDLKLVRAGKAFAHVIVIDPVSGEQFLYVFDSDVIENDPPHCRVDFMSNLNKITTVFGVRIVDVFADVRPNGFINGRNGGGVCSTGTKNFGVDGDYVDQAFAEATYDDEIIVVPLVENGIAVDNAGKTFETKFFDEEASTFGNPVLAVAKSLSYVLKATDSNGATFVSDVVVLTEAEEGTGNVVQANFLQNGNYEFLRSGGIAPEDRNDTSYGSCQYGGDSKFDISISRPTVSVSYDLIDPAFLNGSDCPSTISGSFSAQIFRDTNEGIEYFFKTLPDSRGILCTLEEVATGLFALRCNYTNVFVEILNASEIPAGFGLNGGVRFQGNFIQ